MTDKAYFRALAEEMAVLQAEYLLKDVTSLSADMSLSQATVLIRDCLYHLDRPVLAIELALGFHSVVERWSAWSTWIEALDLVLTLPGAYLTTTAKVRLLNCRSQAARALGDYATAEQFAVEALHLAQAQQDSKLIGESYNRLGAIAFFRDDFVAARAQFEQAYICGMDHLPVLELGNISMNLGTIAMHQDRFPEAHQHFDEAIRHFQAHGQPVYVAKAQSNRAELLRREGRPHEALESLLTARAVFRAAGARFDYGLVENDLGCAYLTLQQWEQALDAFGVAIDILEQIGSLSGKALVLSNLAELCVTTEQWEKAVPALDQAYALAMICGREVLAAAVEVDRGRMLAAQGDYAGARRVWEGVLHVQETKGAWLAAQQTRRLIDGLPPISRLSGGTGL